MSELRSDGDDVIKDICPLVGGKLTAGEHTGDDLLGKLVQGIVGLVINLVQCFEIEKSGPDSHQREEHQRQAHGYAVHQLHDSCCCCCAPDRGTSLYPKPYTALISMSARAAWSLRRRFFICA